jgi:acyl carrier protein phosphodiesterase
VYAKAPAGLPNPFELPNVKAGKTNFDVDLSERRFTVVDVLYDQLVSFQLEPLKKVTKTLHEVDGRLAKRANPQAAALVAVARALIAAMPVNAAQAVSDEIVNAFKGQGGAGKGPRQAELEQQWASFAKENYAKAQAKADEALKLAN